MEENKKSKLGLGVLIGVLVTLVLCIGVFIVYDKVLSKDNNTDDENKVNTTPNVIKSEYRISDNSLQKFDLAFLKLENEKKNKVYSPLSIKYALQMLGEGSNGTTKAQIDSVIGDYVTKKYTNSSNMSFANAIFIRDTYKNNINKNYINNLNNKYNAEVIYDSFANANNINRWVSNKTFNLIDNLVDSVDDVDFALINALAIDMEWVNKIQSDEGFYTVEYNHENFAMNILPFMGTGYHELNFDNSKQKVKSVEIGAAINKYDIVNTIGEDNIRQTVKKEYEEYLKNPCSDDEPDADTFVEQYIKDINANYKQISSSTDFEFYSDDNVKAFAKDLKEYNGTTLQYIAIMPKKDSLDNYIKNIDTTKINNIIPLNSFCFMLSPFAYLKFILFYTNFE